MKMKKQRKIFALSGDSLIHSLKRAGAWYGRLWILMVLWCVIMTGIVYGQEPEESEISRRRVYDMAQILDAAYVDQAEGVIADYQEKYQLDIVIVTSEDTEGKTATAYADDFYEAGGFGQGSGKDGILFLVDMDNRELVFSTEGKAIRIFTDERIESMLDHVYEGASKGDYTASTDAFLADVEQWCKAGIPGGQYNYDTETGKVSMHKSIRWYEALLALGISVFTAGSVCAAIKRQYGMEQDQRQVRNLNMAYRSEARFAYNSQKDQFIDKFVTTQRIPRNTGRGSGGGGHSSPGRSSTHTSSSGRSHGGGSRKF